MKSTGLLVFTLAAGVGHAPAAEVFPIATNSALTEFGGRVVLAGTNYFASVITGNNLAGQQLNANGQLLGAPVILGANPGFPPAAAVATAKTNALVVWTDYSVASGVGMFGRLVSPGGLGSTFPLLSAAGGHGVQAVQAAASDGTNFLAVWRDNANGAFYGQKVSNAGALSGSEFLLFTLAGQGDRNIAVAYGRTNYLVAWQDGTGGGDQTYCKLISLSGTAGPAFQVNTTSSSDINPMAVGCDGTNYLVVWNRATNYSSGGWPAWQLCGRLVSQSGVALGGELVLVTEQAAFPALAFDGENYLLAWGYDTATTNNNPTIRAQYFDRAGKASGPILTPFSAQGTNPPLLALDGVLFDGQRFLLSATFGRFLLSPEGDITGFAGGDVFGTFLPSSTKPPVFTNASVVGGLFQGQLEVVPGIIYTIETSSNLSSWMPVATVGSATTNRLDLQDDRPVTGQSRLFYRAVAGNHIPLTFTFNFHHYAGAGSFGNALSPTVSFPVTLGGYTANFGVVNDAGLPPAATVFFTGPPGSGLSSQPADPNNSWVNDSEAEYQSPVVSAPPAAPGGTWTVNYHGTNLIFNATDPQAASRLVIPLPTVTVTGDVLQAVSWIYHNATTGAPLGGAPAYVTNLQLQIDGLVDGRIYDSPRLAPGVTEHTLASSVIWNDVSNLHMAYDDSLGNHYVVSFTKP